MYRPLPNVLRLGAALALLFILPTGLSAQFDLVITEIFPGQSGTDLTADWFEITNQGTSAWVAGVDADLYYDDESADASTADLITGITDIGPGERVIVVLSGAATLTVQDVACRLIMTRQLEAVAGANQVRVTTAELGGATGVLTYTLTAGYFSATKKMVVVK
ncbi:MAG: hypothetical protein AAGA31_19490 [Bacteroidota bacterium]